MRKLKQKPCLHCKKMFKQNYSDSQKHWKENRKHCSKACANKSRKWTYEMRIKGGVARSGLKNGNWSGGRLRYMCNLAKERDDYTCKKCGFNDDVEILEVDHIKPKRIAPELVRTLDNLITLCPNCHKRKTLDDMKTYPQKWRNQHSSHKEVIKTE